MDLLLRCPSPDESLALDAYRLLTQGPVIEASSSLSKVSDFQSSEFIAQELPAPSDNAKTGPASNMHYPPIANATSAVVAAFSGTTAPKRSLYMSDVQSWSEPTTAPKRARGSVWNPKLVATGPTSPLVDADLLSMLANPMAILSVSMAQKEELLKLFPDQVPVADIRGMEAFLQNVGNHNTDWRRSIREFQEDLADGRLQVKWIKQAANAGDAHANGKFDVWKKEKTEDNFGEVKAKDLPGSSGGFAHSKLKLDELVRGGCFEIGDVWLVSKQLSSKTSPKESALVEKEAKILALQPRCRPTLSYPAGQDKMSPGPTGPDIIVREVTGPATVVQEMAKADGRLAGPAVGGPWSSIRLVRNGQDMGTLEDIREAFHETHKNLKGSYETKTKRGEA